MTVQNTNDYPQITSWELDSNGEWHAYGVHDDVLSMYPEVAPSLTTQQEIVHRLDDKECCDLVDRIEAVFASHRVPVRFDYKSNGSTVIFTPKHQGINPLDTMSVVSKMREAGHRITVDFFSCYSHDFTLRYGAGVKMRCDPSDD
jgi:hypothetical protein